MCHQGQPLAVSTYGTSQHRCLITSLLSLHLVKRLFDKASPKCLITSLLCRCRAFRATSLAGWRTVVSTLALDATLRVLPGP